MLRKISLVVFLIIFFFLNCVINNNTILCLTPSGDNEELLAGIEDEEEEEEEVCITSRVLQKGWVEYFDDVQKRHYYHRSSDDITQWEYPMEACENEYNSYVRLARLILQINGINLCTRRYNTMPILSYQYTGVLIEPSASWCWDPVERPGLCYIYFVKYFEMGKRFMTLLLRPSSSTLRSRILTLLGINSNIDAEFIELLNQFLESFKVVSNGDKNRGLQYKGNEEYFSREYVKKQITLKNKLYIQNDTAKDNNLFLKHFENRILADKPFDICKSSRLSLLLQNAENNVYQRSPRRPLVWADSSFSNKIYGEVARGDIQSLSNRLISEEIGDTENKINELRSADGRGALWWAYENNNMKIVELLVKYGSWIEDRDSLGLKPHHLQKLNGPKSKRSVFACKNVVDLDKGENDNAKGGANGNYIKTGQLVCSHEHEDLSDQIIDDIVRAPYVAPDLMNSDAFHIEVDGDGNMHIP
jgi:hypothetical protein